MDKQFDSSKFNDQPGFKNLESSEKEAWEIMETAKEIKKPFGGKISGTDLNIAEKVVEMQEKDKEMDELIDEIIDNKRKARAARSDAAREVYEEKVALYEKKLQQIKQAWEKTGQEEKENERKNKFNEFLKDKFSDFKGDHFETTLPGLDYIVIFKGPVNPENGKIESLEVYPYWHRNDTEVKITCTIYKDGLLYIGTQNGRLPNDLSFTKEELYDEVLSIAEIANLDFYENVDDKILPSGNWPPSKEKEKNSKVQQEVKHPIDSRRLRFMENQSNVLFGIQGMDSGFSGYYGYVFKNFLLLENNVVGNATYFFDFESPLEVNSGRIGKADRAAILQQQWEPIANLSKPEALDAGAERKWHPITDIDDDHWEEIMQAEIDRRS